MVRRKGAHREGEPGDLDEGASKRPLSSSWANLERLPPPPQLPADGRSLIAPKWTRGRGNDLAEPAASPSMNHHQRSVVGRIARYDVLGRVHHGREVSVYLARSFYPKAELVALKVSRAAQVGSPSDKVSATHGSWSDALRAVAHPSLATLVEITRHESLKCVVHGWLDGVPLDRLLTRLTALEKPMAPHIAASIVAQLAAGIDHAEHMLATRGVPESAGPHAILPNDVIICPDGRAVLLDLRWRDAPTPSTTGRKSVQILGDLMLSLLDGKPTTRNDAPAPFSFRVSHALPPELSEIIERTRPDHPERFADALALSTALQHFVGYESNQEEREVIAAFVDEQFPDASGREPHIQTGPEVRRAVHTVHVDTQLAAEASVKLTDVSFEPASRRARPWLWVVGAMLLLLAGYLLGLSR